MKLGKRVDTARLIKAMMFGMFVAVGGLLLSFAPVSRGWEENLGLGRLFQLRGVRPPPMDAVVISIDQESSELLNVPNNPDKWPRSLHADLVDTLVRAGAKVITFDLHFIEPRVSKDDQLFAKAIQKAGNVVLADALMARELRMPGPEGTPANTNSVVRAVKPFAPFAESAVGTAPFVLPRIPFKVNQYWTFQTDAGGTPTIPSVAFQLYALQVYEDLVGLLEQAGAEQAGRLPRDAETAIKARGAVGLIRDLRGMFEADPLLAVRMLEGVERSDLPARDPERVRLLRALIQLYRGGDSRYVNYYGPPRTITTIPYHQALRLGQGGAAASQIDLKGKAVFVGLSEILLAERKDSFYTVFSQANGVFVSGVEIAATAFLNTLENSSVEPISLWSHVLLLLVWGLLMGILPRMAPTVVAGVAVVGLNGAYLGLAVHQFQAAHLWWPLINPLLFQTPVGFFGAVLWNYFETDKERKNIRKAFGYYLPNDVVDQLAKDISTIKAGSEVVYGTCLFTDASDYTALSEKLNPKELSDFLGKYYETLFTPVRNEGGLIVDLKGDSILAIWKASEDEAVIRKQACLAALGIAKSVDRFNRSVAPLGLPTRIGLHAGQLTIGTVGAVDHYEYRPTGDVINTASRVEGFNKYLGTQVAVTDEVIRGLDGLMTRELGTFRLKGKAKALVLHELLCLTEEIDETQRQAYAIFVGALGAFRKQSWDEAQAGFQHCLDLLEKDGPSSFYIPLCKQYIEAPPQEWDEIVTLEKK